MFKILKNLKKSIFSVIIIIILLSIQAMADLALPDYTSRVVNIGIQQNGIENTIPEVVRYSKMQDMLIFTDDSDKVLQSYTLISKQTLSEIDYNLYVKKYPLLQDEDLYVLNKISKKDQEELEVIMTKIILSLSLVTNKNQTMQGYEELLNEFSEESKEKYDELTLESVKKMNAIEVWSFIDEAYDKLSSLLGDLVNQLAIAQIKAEYEAVGINLEEYQNHYILKVGGQMLGIALISMACAISIVLLSARVAAKLGKNLRDKVFRKVLKFTTKEFRDFSTASLITRSTNDIQQIQMLIAVMFRVVVYAPIMGIGGFIRVWNNSNMSMAWIIGMAVLAILFIVMSLFLVAMPKFKRLQDLIDRINLVSREILTGLPVIRAFNTEKREEDRFDKINKDLMKTNVFVNTAMSVMMPALTLVMNVITIVIVWFGGKNVDSGAMQVGDVIAFIQYTIQIVTSFLMISLISIVLPRASISANRINEVLDKELEITDPENEKEFDESKKGYVEFKNVSFRYPDADAEILTDISFVAKPR